MPEGHRVSPFAKALWIKLYIRRAVPLFIGKSKKLKHFVGKRKSDEIETIQYNKICTLHVSFRCMSAYQFLSKGMISSNHQICYVP